MDSRLVALGRMRVWGAGAPLLSFPETASRIQYRNLSGMSRMFIRPCFLYGILARMWEKRVHNLRISTSKVSYLSSAQRSPALAKASNS